MATYDAMPLVSHLKHCQPELTARQEQRWRTKMGPLLQQFDVNKKP